MLSLPGDSLMNGRVSIRVHFMHHLIYGIKYRLCIRLGPVVAVTAVGGAVRFGSESTRFGIEVIVAALLFDHLLQHISRRPAWHVFVQEEHAVRFLQRFHGPAM